jgi:hypothetical protein
MSARLRVWVPLVATVVLFATVKFFDGGVNRWRRCVEQDAVNYSDQSSQRRSKRAYVGSSIHCTWLFGTGNDKVLVVVFTGTLAWLALLTWGEMRESSERGQRAYLSVRWVQRYGSPGGLHQSYEVELRNHGETPALRASASTQMHPMRTDAAEHFDFPEWDDGDPRGDLVVYKDNPRIVTAHFSEPALTRAQWESIERGTDGDGNPFRLYCWGVARYEDIFGRWHWTRYCVAFGGEYSFPPGKPERAPVFHRYNDTSDAADRKRRAPTRVQPRTRKPENLVVGPPIVPDVHNGWFQRTMGWVCTHAPWLP